MKSKILSVLGVSALLAACCCDTPEPSPVEVVQATGIAPGTREDFVCNVGDRVYFAFDKSNITDASKCTLQSQAKWLQKYPQYDITVVGHCDERGTEEYNFGLGERRAEAAKKILVQCGIAASRVNVCSKGKTDPIVIGNDEAAWAKNRVSITILTGGASCVAPSSAAPCGTDTNEMPSM
jgi:peptidoglycan-associated lipoprotein